MVNYISVAEPSDIKSTFAKPDEDFSIPSWSVQVKTYEVPDDIYIEKTNNYSYDKPNWTDGPKVWLRFRWKGKQYVNYLTVQEYEDIIYHDEATMGAYYLIEPFIKTLQEDHKEVLYYFVREVAKIGHDFDVKRLMWLVNHDGQDVLWSDKFGDVKNPAADWDLIDDPYSDQKYYVNKSQLGWLDGSDHKPMYYNYPTPAYEASAIQREVSMKSKQLPGMDTLVELPCGCEYVYKVNPIKPEEAVPAEPTAWRVVQHLNDRHKWTREKIADWLDELHDSGKINIEFETPKENDE